MWEGDVPPPTQTKPKMLIKVFFKSKHPKIYYLEVFFVLKFGNILYIYIYIFFFFFFGGGGGEASPAPPPPSLDEILLTLHGLFI